MNKKEAIDALFSIALSEYVSYEDYVILMEVIPHIIDGNKDIKDPKLQDINILADNFKRRWRLK